MSDRSLPRIFDLTKPLNDTIAIYPGDPPFACREWCSIAEHGYRVSALSLGTQTGTHIDAPAHFDPDGACLEALPAESLVGSYFIVELPPADFDAHAALSGYGNEPILFFRTREPQGVLDPEELETLLQVPVRLWVVAGEVIVRSAPPLEFHRRLAEAGKFLVEDLRVEVAQQIPKTGELFVAPLALLGTSGAPCRVLVRAN